MGFDAFKKYLYILLTYNIQYINDFFFSFAFSLSTQFHNLFQISLCKENSSSYVKNEKIPEDVNFWGDFGTSKFRTKEYNMENKQLKNARKIKVVKIKFWKAFWYSRIIHDFIILNTIWNREEQFFLLNYFKGLKDFKGLFKGLY